MHGLDRGPGRQDVRNHGRRLQSVRRRGPRAAAMGAAMVVSIEGSCRSADGRQMLEGERGAGQRVALGPIDKRRGRKVTTLERHNYSDKGQASQPGAAQPLRQGDHHAAHGRAPRAGTEARTEGGALDRRPASRSGSGVIQLSAQCGKWSGSRPHPAPVRGSSSKLKSVSWQLLPPRSRQVHLSHGSRRRGCPRCRRNT